jgi:hypothetical protein
MLCGAMLLLPGRNVVSLVENLRKSLPPSMGVLQRIMALEQVAAELTDRWGGLGRLLMVVVVCVCGGGVVWGGGAQPVFATQ